MARKINTIVVGESKYGDIEKGYTIMPERAKIYKWMVVVDEITFVKEKELYVIRIGTKGFTVDEKLVQEVHYK